MVNFSSLVSKYSVIALIFFSVLGLSTILYLNNSIEIQSKQHKSTVKLLANQFELPEHFDKVQSQKVAKKLAEVLQNINQYQYLTIKKNDDILINYKNTKAQPPSFITLEPQKVSSNKLKMLIVYQLDFGKQIVLFVKFLTIMLTITLVFILCVIKFNLTLQHRLFNSVSTQIKKELAQVKMAENSNDNDPTIEIPALTEGIAEIKTLLSEQAQSSARFEKEAYTDFLTGLDNRNKFVQFYEKKVRQDSPINFGVLLITRCSELPTINQTHGYGEGDRYIKSIANIINNAVQRYPKGKLFRLNHSDFATILPNELLQKAEEYAEDLTQKFNELRHTFDNCDAVAFTGLVFFDKSKSLGELLALADTGVSVAQTKNSNSWYSLKDTDILNSEDSNASNQNWCKEIEAVLESRHISLLLQPIQPSGRNSKVYSEILARFINKNEEMLPTAAFIAMAEKLDKIVDIDKLIIDSTIQEITNKNMLEQSYGINISPRSINNEHFMIWLERKLLREPNTAQKLIFEISEFGLQQNIKTSKRLIDMLHRVGARVTVERFGIGLTSFKLFKDLTPDYIKMDSSYTRNIDDDKNNQYFLRLMVDLAHRLGINVLTESVETQEEKHTLEKLFIDGCQGFYVGKPAPL